MDMLRVKIFVVRNWPKMLMVGIFIATVIISAKFCPGQRDDL